MSTTTLPIPAPTTDKPPRPRRWVPLSLRMFVTMLVLLGLGSSLFTWLTYRRVKQAYHREQQVIREIHGWGGIASTQTGGEEWLRKLARKNGPIDPKFFERISFILLDEKAVTDEGLAQFQLGTLTNLDGVSFDRSAVTDAGLAQLSGLTKLRQVSVNGTAVSDAGLAHLAGLTNLEYALLARTAVTDAGLVHLSKLTNLRFVFLSRTAVTDSGLAHLSGLTKLEQLFLDDTAVTDEGLVHLHGLTGLQILRLANTQVTDAGIAELQRALPNLSINK